MIVGLDLIRSLPVGDPPALPAHMVRVRVLGDLPSAEQPTIYVLNTLSPQFWGVVSDARAARGADFSICDVEAPVKVVSMGAPPAAQRRPRRPHAALSPIAPRAASALSY